MSQETYEKLWIPFSNTTQILVNTNPGFSVFCRIMPYTLASVTGTTTTTQPAPVPTAQTNRISDGGGPVFNKYNAQVYNIFWGNEWNSTSVSPYFGGGNVNCVSLRNTLTSAFQTIANSDYHKGLWQYRNIKAPIIGGNVVHTATALPSSSADLWTTEIENCIKAAWQSGQVPNPAATPEPAWSWGRLDYRHLYIVILPPNRHFRYGGTDQPASGIAMRAATLVPDIYYCYGALSPAIGDAQRVGQSWGHELIHDLSDPYFYGDCTSGNNGFYVYTPEQEPQYRCVTGLNHYSCYGEFRRVRTLSGTNITVDSYWSDMDGACIAPGTGDSWTRPPVTPPPPPPLPPSPPTQSGGIRCIWIKQDDKNNGAAAFLGSDGTVYFNVKVNNQRFKIRSNPQAITANAWHQLWFTFNKQTNAIDMYVNNVRYNTPSTINELWNDRHSHFIIGNFDTGSATAPLRGRIDDFRLYRNGVVTSTNVTAMWENNHTIETVPVGQGYSIAIAGFVKLDEPLNNDVFVTANFESDILPPASPSPPPAPPGTDDLPPPSPPSTPPHDPPDESQIIQMTAPAPPDPSPPILTEPIVCE